MSKLFIELGVSLSPNKFVRNVVKHFDDDLINRFRKKYRNTDVFTTVYKYNCKKIREGKQLAPLYFDFDGKYALEDLKELVKFLINQHCPKESILIFFSGSKGFHLEIIFESLGIEPDRQLNKLYEVIAKQIKHQLH